MSHFQKRLALLKRPSFLIYILGFLFAAIGNGLGYIAMSWIVVSKYPQHGVTAMAILMICFWGPNIFLGPFMGVLADRLSRKNVMMISNLARAVIFILFSFYLSEHFSVNIVYLMMFCIGVAFSAFFSCAFAFLRELVDITDLMYANSMIDITYESGNLIGMGMAGLLIAWTSSDTAILINGIAYVIATLSMILIPKRALLYGSDKHAPIKIFKDFVDGLRYLQQNKPLIIIYSIQLLIFVVYLTSPLLLVPFSKHILHATVEQFGIIEATASIGIVCGGILLPWISEILGFLKTIFVFIVMLLIAFAIFGYNRSIPIAIALYFIIGFAGAIWPLIITKAQGLTNIDFQGRVQSTFNSLSGVFMMAVYFGIALMGNTIGITHLYLIEVLFTLVAIVFLVRHRLIVNG